MLHSRSCFTSNRNLLPPLAIASFTLRFRTQTQVWMPGFSGSLWRGVIGTALRKAHCLTQATSCFGCPLKTACAYHRMIECGGNHTRAYVIHPPMPGEAQHYHEREHLGVGLTLLGQETDHLDDWLQPLEQLRDTAFARNGGRIRLVQVFQQRSDGQSKCVFDEGRREPLSSAENPPIPAVPKRASIRLETPLRVVRRGSALVGGQFGALDFLDSLKKRYSFLLHHASGIADWSGDYLDAAANQFKVTNADFRTYKLARLSRRKSVPMRLDGVLGSFHLEGEGLAVWWPLIWMGQYFNTGKGTVMGLGRYRCQPEYNNGADRVKLRWSDANHARLSSRNSSVFSGALHV